MGKKSTHLLNYLKQPFFTYKIASAHLGNTHTKIRMIPRRLVWPLHKNDTQIHGALHFFLMAIYTWSLYSSIGLSLPTAVTSALFTLALYYVLYLLKKELFIIFKEHL